MSGPATSHPPVGELLESALEFALEAGESVLARFGAGGAVDVKGDGTPVTEADREAETLLRERIRTRFPGHGILGEEFEETPGSEAVRWILDPIDGTRSFVRGVPLFAVLVGVEVGREAVAGVVHFPALEETVWAGSGLGCRWVRKEGEAPVPARVSPVRALSGALALTTDPGRILASPVASGWAALSGEVNLVRGWGDAYGHVLVATGRAEVMVDPVLAPWDAAPLLPILREAGGRFTDLAGRETHVGGSGISTNGLLHDTVRRRLDDTGA